MLKMRGNTLPQRTLHPTDHVQQNPTQPTTGHSRRGRTGRERHDIEADVDEGGPRAQAATDRMRRRPAPSPAPLPSDKTQPTSHTSTNDPDCRKPAHRRRAPEDAHALPQRMGVLRATPADKPRVRPQQLQATRRSANSARLLFCFCKKQIQDIIIMCV